MRVPGERRASQDPNPPNKKLTILADNQHRVPDLKVSHAGIEVLQAGIWERDWLQTSQRPTPNFFQNGHSCASERTPRQARNTVLQVRKNQFRKKHGNVADGEKH